MMKSTSLAVSTSCSHCCIETLLTGCTCGCTRWCSAAAKRMFADGTAPTALRLTESVTYPNGMLQLAYETAGAPTYGNLAIDAQPTTARRR
jgi:hypothetical protein